MILTKANPSRGRGSLTDHSGATSVASALGIRPGATPFGPIHTNMPFPVLPSKVDTSIQRTLGHFYLALTEASATAVSRVGSNRGQRRWK